MSASFSARFAAVAALMALLASPVRAAGSEPAGPAKGNCGYAMVFSAPIAQIPPFQEAARGIKEAAEQLGVKVDISDSANVAAFRNNLVGYASKGCYVAIGTMFSAAIATLNQVADQFPNQKFFLTDTDRGGINVTKYVMPYEELLYVGGAMAAKISKTHVLGMTTFSLEDPTAGRLFYGFERGAKSVDPGVSAYLEATNAGNDPNAALAAAVRLSAKKADLIYNSSIADSLVVSSGAKYGYSAIVSHPGLYRLAAQRNAPVGFVALVDFAQELNAIIHDLVKNGPDGKVHFLGFREKVFNIPGLSSPNLIDDKPPVFTLAADAIAAGKKALNDIESGAVKLSPPGVSVRQ